MTEMDSVVLRGPVVRALGLHAADPGSSPLHTSGLDLLAVDGPEFNSITLCKKPTGCLLPIGVLIMFLLSLNCFFQILKSGVSVK